MAAPSFSRVSMMSGVGDGVGVSVGDGVTVGDCVGDIVAVGSMGETATSTTLSAGVASFVAVGELVGMVETAVSVGSGSRCLCCSWFDCCFQRGSRCRRPLDTVHC